MTDAKWNQKFDQLMDLHLIPVPEEYFQEEILFKDPEEL